MPKTKKFAATVAAIFIAGSLAACGTDPAHSSQNATSSPTETTTQTATPTMQEPTQTSVETDTTTSSETVTPIEACINLEQAAHDFIAYQGDDVRFNVENNLTKITSALDQNINEPPGPVQVGGRFALTKRAFDRWDGTYDDTDNLLDAIEYLGDLFESCSEIS